MFFIASKVVWFLIQPVTIVLILLLVVALLSFARLRWPSRLGLVTAILVIALGAYTTLGSLALHPLETAFPRPAPPAAITGVIVLGGGIETDINAARGGYEFNRSGDRYVEALRLARLYPQARIVVSGGNAALFPGAQTETEAASAARFLVDFGVVPSRITIEDASRNTEENAQLTRDTLGPGQGDTWLLVTSAFHMPRAVGLFRKAGFAVIPWPADYLTTGREGLALRLDQPAETLSITSLALREWVGLLAYRLTGKIDDLLPRPAP